MIAVGIDIGSTTIKVVVLDNEDKVIYSTYKRHYSKIAEKLEEVLSDLKKDILKGQTKVHLSFSGSAGMGIADSLYLPFSQEVYATREATKRFYKDTDCIIELGGEDAKILFLNGSVEVRMNGTCAGGTGAFIDQMASLLNVPIEKMDELAEEHTKIYTIASRCGVFAKSDIQPLLNQGAQKADIAESIFYAVCNQTIAGLAQGREIQGNVMYLGGPLTFMSNLRKTFDKVLGVSGLLPENSLYFVAIGSALLSKKDEEVDISNIVNRIKNYTNDENFSYIEPLFKDEKEYLTFKEEHEKDFVPILSLKGYKGPLYLGIDSGSTTLKAVLIDDEYNIRYSYYVTNQGDPVSLVKDMLINIYNQLEEGAYIKGASSTGYGEDLIKNAFSLDHGLVETMAHFEAAKHFLKDVEFVIDIGGQDIKCFRIKNGVIDDIFLNEACSSGCGSFLQTFASSLGYSIEEFTKLAIAAKRPVNLGSRCTVFMNSSVKQAQKDGASINDIAAGLSISVVKNALYKVIRCSSKDDLGKNIVVQGGTFLNDAVLRAFEKELGVKVIRSNVAGLMGAYGASLDSKNLNLEHSSILSKEELEHFERKVISTICQGCNNKCHLTISNFGKNRIFIGGNRCEKPVTKKATDLKLDLYDFKYRLLRSYDHSEDKKEYPRGTIGIPLGLNFYELLPFFSTLFTSLGFKVILSDPSSSKLYHQGQMTIPSDTVCYPAKLLHGHIMNLYQKGIKTIFYPCMSYNIKEKGTDNHYNCPVVAYYSEVILANMKILNDVTYLKPYLNLSEKKYLPQKLYEYLSNYYDLSLNEVKKACEKAYREYDKYEKIILNKGLDILEQSKKENRLVICLAGRPYHVDPLINHDIDKLILGFGASIISEDILAKLVKKDDNVTVLNQWTYHSRLYKASDYITEHKGVELIQLVSFGCGVDAVTSDEVRDHLERHNHIYTQVKIDEITNMGAVKIRIRSLLEALRKRENDGQA